ncbi:MAG: hypothetical protein GY908_10390 [Flavobacteriales bacterium]|nr:hypothetical protein [Flavobacteriales bacterium]
MKRDALEIFLFTVFIGCFLSSGKEAHALNIPLSDSTSFSVASSGIPPIVYRLPSAPTGIGSYKLVSLSNESKLKVIKKRTWKI